MAYQRNPETYHAMSDAQIVMMTSPMAAAMNLLEAAEIALLHADRKQKKNWGEDMAILGLPGSFTYDGAHENLAGSMKLFNLWCKKHNVDPAMHLKAHGITEANARAYLEYGAFAVENFGQAKKAK